MKILFFCTRWGQEQIHWNEFCKIVKDAGYDGIETSLPLDAKETEQIVEAIKQQGLQWIGQHWDTVTPDFNQHISEYEQRLRAMAAAKPLFITSHTGKDFYTFEQNERLLLLAQEISEEIGIKIIHETHRGKFSFAAHLTKSYLQKHQWLKLTLDISHWFTVAESYLADQQEAVDLALSHTDHIHARIGFANGPQVNYPRSPEWNKVLQKHFFYWDKVIDMHKSKGSAQFTFTSEFGPFPYMQLQPFTDIPIANQWETNLYMKNLLKDKYKN